MSSPWLVCAAADPRRRSSLDRRARSGELWRVLPGIYLHPQVADDVRWRVIALSRWRPDAVVCGGAAAALTYAPGTRVTVTDVALRTQVRAPGFRFTRRQIQPEHVIEVAGVRVTVPALTALDIARANGPDAIDEVLRARATDLTGLWTTLRANSDRAGNGVLAGYLRDSRDGPWSAAERLLHRILRANGVSGWRANAPVRANGRRYFLDVAFAGSRVAIEVDGRGHDTPTAFEYDRIRDNDLVRTGWTVLHVTWRMLTDDPDDVVRLIRATLRARARRTA